jgi:lysozyme
MFKTILNILKSFKKQAPKTVETSPKGYVVTQSALDMIKKYEGFRSKAYQDGVGVWTIGYGNTFYPDGQRVKEGDMITEEDAEKLLSIVVDDFAKKITDEIRVQLTNCQFGALVSFTYNVGIGAFRRSTLLRKVNADPEDPEIKKEFLRWSKAGGKTYPGLLKRRNEESKFYYKQNC